jgi:NitT/TauT family transport system substrate-binding protein
MKFIVRTIAAVLLPVLLVACDKTPAPPLVFGSSLWMGYEPVYLARDLGYFSADNLRLDEYGQASEVQQAFRKHELHLAAVTLDEALQLRRDIPDLKIVLLFDASNGADVILAQSGIANMNQLQGHRVGMENTVQGEYLLSLALKSSGMQTGQVEIVPMPVAEQEAAFRAHKVDALVTSDPVRMRLLETGAQNVFDSARVPGKILNVLVTRDDDMGRYHHEMVELVRGWQRALEYIHAEPDKAMQAMSRHKHVDAIQFGRAMQGIELLGLQRNRELLLGEQPAVGISVEAVQRFLLERGLINMGADTSTLLDTSLLAGGVQ